MRNVTLCLFVLLLSLPNVLAAQELEIINIRVGQGDSTLIQGPPDVAGNRINVLFDAADIPARDGGNILRAVLNKRGVDELDFLVISHDDADHLGGVAAGGVHGTSFLLGFNNVPGDVGDDDSDGDVDWVGTEFFNPDPDELGTGDDLFVHNFVDYGDAVMRDGVQAISKYQGMANAMGNRIVIDDQSDVDGFEIDLGGGARMICFAANGFVRDRTARVDDVNTPNERSLSFLVTFGEFDYLISGDLIGQKTSPFSFSSENAAVEFAVGESLVANGFDVDVLHVNHHGANNTSEDRFLDLIKPNIAIISAGNGNSHKHPTNGTLKRLTTAGVDRIFQTSWGTTENRVSEEVRDHHAVWQQDIVIRTDGDTYSIETNRSWSAR